MTGRDVAVLMAMGCALVFAVWAMLQVVPKQLRIGTLFGHHCPECSSRLPMIRRPANERQWIHGGWTCRQCGVELDRFGMPIDKGCKRCGYSLRGLSDDACPECGMTVNRQ